MNIDNEDRTRKVIDLLLLLFGCCFIVIWFFYGSRYVLFPYQHEYREGAALPVVRLFAEGKNPYSYQFQPANTYVYGFLNPLLSTVICKIFGVGIVQVRFFSLICVVITSVLLGVFSYKKNGNISHSVFLVCLFLFMQKGTLSAMPNDLGTLLLIGSVLCVLHYGYSLKVYGVTILLAVLGFYTKPFYLIILGYVAVDLFLFKSKKAGIIYFIVGFGFFFLTLFLINAVFPAYINNNVFHHMGGVSAYHPDYMLEQWKYYIDKNSLILIAALAVVIDSFVEWKNKKIELNISSLIKPLINIDSGSSHFIGESILIISILFTVKLGHHMGTGEGEYLFRLCSPLLALLFFYRMDRVLNRSIFALVMCLLVLFVGIQFPGLVHRDHALSAYREDLDRIAELIESDSDVYASPNLVSILIDKGKEVYESGMSEYFITGDNHYAEKICDTSWVRTVYDSYVNKINGKIESEGFDSLYLSSGSFWLINKDILQKHYVKKEELPCAQAINAFTIEHWVKNK